MVRQTFSRVSRVIEAVNGLSVKGVARPEWLGEYRRKTALIDAIDLAFSENCDCGACRKLREAAPELGDLFMPGKAPGPKGGEEPRQPRQAREK